MMTCSNVVRAKVTCNIGECLIVNRRTETYHADERKKSVHAQHKQCSAAAAAQPNPFSCAINIIIVSVGNESNANCSVNGMKIKSHGPISQYTQMRNACRLVTQNGRNTRWSLAQPKSMPPELFHWLNVCFDGVSPVFAIRQAQCALHHRMYEHIYIQIRENANQTMSIVLVENNISIDVVE